MNGDGGRGRGGRGRGGGGRGRGGSDVTVESSLAEASGQYGNYGHFCLSLWCLP